MIEHANDDDSALFGTSVQSPSLGGGFASNGGDPVPDAISAGNVGRRPHRNSSQSALDFGVDSEVDGNVDIESPGFFFSSNRGISVDESKHRASVDEMADYDSLFFTDDEEAGSAAGPNPRQLSGSTPLPALDGIIFAPARGGVRSTGTVETTMEAGHERRHSMSFRPGARGPNSRAAVSCCRRCLWGGCASADVGACCQRACIGFMWSCTGCAAVASWTGRGRTVRSLAAPWRGV
jgi:hypothetical protein